MPVRLNLLGTCLRPYASCPLFRDALSACLVNSLLLRLCVVPQERLTVLDTQQYETQDGQKL